MAPFPGADERLAESARAIIAMMARAPKAKRICARCGPTAANTLSDEPTVNPAVFGNSATRSAAIDLAGISLVCSSGSAAINAVSRTAAVVPGHPRQAGGFLPGIDIQPRKRGKDAERRSVSILADRRVEELVELRSDERR